MTDTALKNEEIIQKGIDEFIRRWGLLPNGILMNQRTLRNLRVEHQLDLKFDSIPIYRSHDTNDNEIKFVI